MTVLPSRTQVLTNQLIILLFLTAISLPMLRQLGGPQATESKTEQRVLAQWPAIRFDRQGIEAFPKEFERYFSDHFGYRDQLIFGHHYLKAMFFNVSPVDKVLMGKGGWLYFTINDQIKDYQGLLRYTDQDLAGITNTLQQRQDMLARLGMKYLLVLAPNKQSLYPEYLPDSLVKVGTETKLDQLVGYLKVNSSVNVLDLRGPLLAVKSKLPAGELLYLTQDTHWNQRGAFIAYQAIMKAVRDWYPDARTLTDSDVTIETKQSVRGDLANMIGMKEILQEQAPFLTVTSVKAQRDGENNEFLGLFAGRYPEDYKVPFMTKCDTAQQRAVVFRDSFFTDLVPFVEESFQHATYFYESYNEGVMVELLSRKLKPDLVIEEIVERDL